MTAPNAELAYAVLDQIDLHPEQWSQGVWVDEADCGKIGCFAGWAVLLSGYQVERNHVTQSPEGGRDLNAHHVEIAAELLLGLEKTMLMEHGDPFDGLLLRRDLDRVVAEIFGPRPASMPPVADHAWRPRTKDGAGAGDLLDRPCEYANCGRPRAEHQRAVAS